MSDLLDGLNERQLEAIITTVDQSALIIAGAGSGKTSVLTKRIAYLKQLGKSMGKVLAVTFTNKASGEMRERVAQLIGEESAKELTMGTFHKVCIRMLKVWGTHNNIPKNFTIADGSDQSQIMRKTLEKFGIETKAGTIGVFLTKISDLKNNLQTPSDYYQVLSKQPNPVSSDQLTYKVYKDYQERLKRYNMLDFDDLLFEAVMLLRNSEIVRSYYQHRYNYVMVDEYQDTNPCQYELIRLISGKVQAQIPQPNNTFVVGDDYQSIYGFRGSDLSIILNFEQDFPEAKVIKLEQNYRSTKAIVHAGNTIMKNNPAQKHKHLFTANLRGDSIKLLTALDNEDEAKFIATEIQNLIAFGGKKAKDIAVLYRTNFLSRGIEEQLINKRIPYQIIGGVSFYERQEIKDTIAYLKLIVNPQDDVAMRRVLDTYPGVGKTTISKIEDQGGLLNMSLSESYKHYKSSRKATQNALDSLRELLKELHMIYRVAASEKRTDVVTKMMEIVWKRTAYKESLLAKKNSENTGRLENLDELTRVAEIYQKESTEVTLEDFLDDIVLQSDVDRKADGDNVTLMTIHASKGLEYPVIFMMGVEEGIMPHRNSLPSPSAIEEERRLMYVGITRAQLQLYLTNVKRRMTYGGSEYPQPSRFITEIPKEVIQKL
jgi:DNA helicase-2/ATP-dependent DNA helicase PcrA